MSAFVNRVVSDVREYSFVPSPPIDVIDTLAEHGWDGKSGQNFVYWADGSAAVVVFSTGELWSNFNPEKLFEVALRLRTECAAIYESLV